MAKITFSDENQAGDIPTFEIKKQEIYSEFQQPFEELLELRNGKVIVAFQHWESEKYEFQNTTFLISDSCEDVLEFIEKHFQLIKNEEININFFCFHTYEDAFGYCMDLKEGL